MSEVIDALSRVSARARGPAPRGHADAVLATLGYPQGRRARVWRAAAALIALGFMIGAWTLYG